MSMGKFYSFQRFFKKLPMKMRDFQPRFPRKLRNVLVHKLHEITLGTQFLMDKLQKKKNNSILALKYLSFDTHTPHGS